MRGLLQARTSGFTLMEIIIVVAIFGALIALGLFVSMETFRGTIFRSEQDIVVSVLQKARSRALANMYQTPWGVCYIAPNYVVFRGTLCTSGAATNEDIPAKVSSNAVFSAPVVFSPLSATTTGGTITLTEDGRTSTITINHEGTISW